MAVSVAAQARALLGALALGLAAGVLYDLFRVVRVRVRLAFLGPALDLLFWLCCTVAFFLWSAIMKFWRLIRKAASPGLATVRQGSPLPQSANLWTRYR